MTIYELKEKIKDMDDRWPVVLVQLNRHGDEVAEFEVDDIKRADRRENREVVIEVTEI